MFTPTGGRQRVAMSAGSGAKQRPRSRSGDGPVVQIRRLWTSIPHGPNGSCARTSPACRSGRRTPRRRSRSRRSDSETWAGGRSVPASIRRSSGRRVSRTRETGWLHPVGHLRLSLVAVRGALTRHRTHMSMHARWLRHAVPLPAVVVGAWYGVEHASSGAFLLAGAGALAWLVWPEVSRFLAWRRRRRAEGARVRLERSMRRAERIVAKAERARQRADRRPSSARRARRAARMETRAQRALATAARSRDRATAIGDDPSQP